MDEEIADIEPAAPAGIGEQLRAAREEKGLSLEQLAAETRIPLRHLGAIESGDFARLPGRTYAVGFSRTYAKVVGLDQEDVAAMVRAELDAREEGESHRPASFEPGDPARVPSRGLGWFAAFAVLLLLAGGFFFMRTLFTPAAELPSLIEQQREERSAAGQGPQTRSPAARTAAAPSGPVVFTALEEGIWVRFYDSSGRLMEKLMARGERYTVPADAEAPMLWTGRPDALAITVGGQPVPKLAEDDVVMRDVPVTAEALLARTRGAGASAAGENPVRPAT